jgi:hypothetical protein
LRESGGLKKIAGFLDHEAMAGLCHPTGAYDNFARDFGERFVPGYKAPSSDDLVMNAPFGE